MLLTLLRLTGLDVKIEELKINLQRRARAAIDRLKRLVLRLALSAGLMFGAATLFLCAVLVGFIALYVWAESRWGTYPALALVGGILLAGAILLLAGAFWAARGAAADEAEEPPSLGPAATSRGTGQPQRETEFARAAGATSRDGLDPFLYLLGRYATVPKSGHGLIDDLLGDLGPRAEAAASDMVKRATILIREGDRKTMLTVLGAAAAVGWLLVRASERERESGTGRTSSR